MRTLAVDIGGSRIKTLVLDTNGEALTELKRLDTPSQSTPAPVIDIICQLAQEQKPFDRVGVGFPGVVRHGVVYTAPNLHSDWENYDLSKELATRLKVPVRIANDADVQGAGAISGKGVELVLTLGTGFGSALFVDGTLVPNLEMGHHPFEKERTYEDRLGRVAKEKAGQEKWERRLLRAIEQLNRLFNCDQIYLGGGETKKLSIALPANTQVVPNILGLLGAISLWRD